ncbi:Nif3-like dinuclear metal center hexameric protein [Sporomusa aerivorans]|uniref:Nif3-like dinuclear metal center hexameric protein n=1 Tax=Sporomusa aerivorans TaxID=204936 RepID=UPI00352A4736
MNEVIKVKDILHALDKITGGRCVKSLDDVFSGRNKFVIMKSSNIPGKACMEMPGLICGNLEAPVKKIAVTMTLTECNIELAGATGVDAIVAHHPVVDAANSGGVTIRGYLNLYGLSVFELHEAFHGLHPGIAYIHGHKAFHADIAYGDIPGNVLYVGKVLPGVSTLGAILDRLNEFMGMQEEQKMLLSEKNLRNCHDICETNVATGGKLLVGTRENRVDTILHIFPHTGFTAQHLEMAKQEHPDADTVIASISRVGTESDLVKKAEELGLNFLIGNCHAMEILENGLPLAMALQKILPEVEVVLFRERITSTPLNKVGTTAIRDYADYIASEYLVNKEGGTGRPA